MRFTRAVFVAALVFGSIGCVLAAYTTNASITYSIGGFIASAQIAAFGALLGGGIFLGLSRLFKTTEVWLRCVSAVLALMVALGPLYWLISRPCSDGALYGIGVVLFFVMPVVGIAAAVFGAGVGQVSRRLPPWMDEHD